ncbi:MAG TPA: DmsC/YnfH family molybdoenzyme membrane anchor subunit [Vicinamibacterales bacterium]
MKRASEDGLALARLTPRTRPEASPAIVPLVRRRPRDPAGPRMPDRAPGPGEQYRFHVDMRACIGCKSCVVACNEQNGNPAPINWRRVGEIEGGFFPQTSRSYLSMGCNHCLEPTCLAGCPVDAYTKDPITGIVSHSADACIGCQYCTWNCSYGVPQYNPERGVVGKCDMCHGRLSLGQAPACVSACPEGALQIEIVKVSEWRRTVERSGAHDGSPSHDGSLSTTRVTLPEATPPNARPRDITHVKPEHPHWSLILMTVLTQMSVGAFVTIWLLQLLGASTRLGLAAAVSLTVGGLALGAATFHLGRPVHAYRALRMWRRSWLSREVLLFGAFSAVAGAYAVLLWTGVAWSAWVGALTVVCGLSGVLASACIYRVPARPAWNTPYTLLQFTLTAGILGPLFAAAAGVGDSRWLAVSAASMAGGQAVVFALRFFRCIASDNAELKGTARLLSTVLARRVLLRALLLVVGAIALPLMAGSPLLLQSPSALGSVRLVMTASLVLAIAAELLERYLFFVSVVPRHMATPYIASASEAV